MTLSVLHGRTESPLSTSAHNKVHTQVYRLPVSLQVGDLIIATGEMVVTNNEAKGSVLSSSQIMITDTPSGVVPIHDGCQITRDGGGNITADPGEHHHAYSRSGALVSPVAGNYWIVMTVYWISDVPAFSDGSSMDGTIEQNYGHLSVTIIRGGVSPL